MDVLPTFHRAALNLALIAFTVGASAHCVAAVATASASCTVIEPVVVTTAANLSFGKFAAGTGGSITISTSGVRTASGVVPSSNGGAMGAAKFIVTGATGATYSIAYGGTAALSRSAGPQTMALTKFSDVSAGNATAGTAPRGGTLTAGTQSIYVGGTLNVAPNQAVGTYAGEVTVTVEYN